MISKKYRNKLIVRIDKGEEIIESLRKACLDNDVRLARVSGIGACNELTIGLFETRENKYHSNDYQGDFEVTSLEGNVTTMKGDLYLHLHINFCDNKNRCYGGHLNKAIVSATFEAILDIIDGEFERKKSEEIGLNLLDANI